MLVHINPCAFSQTLRSPNSFSWTPEVSPLPPSPGCTSRYKSSSVECKTKISVNIAKGEKSQTYTSRTRFSDGSNHVEDRRMKKGREGDHEDQRGWCGDCLEEEKDLVPKVTEAPGTPTNSGASEGPHWPGISPITGHLAHSDISLCPADYASNWSVSWKTNHGPKYLTLTRSPEQRMEALESLEALDHSME